MKICTAMRGPGRQGPDDGATPTYREEQMESTHRDGEDAELRDCSEE